MASSLEGNKILAAILTAGIIGLGSGVLSRMVYGPHMLEEPAFRIEVPESVAGGGAAAPAEEEKPIAVLLASADAEAGAGVAKKCAACHTFDSGGANKIGPNLWGIVGRPVGGHEGFSYSPAMAEHGGEWTYEALDAYLESPKENVPGNKMAFAGLPKATDRADLLAYLRTLSDSPVPLPEAPATEAPATEPEAPAPQSEG
jgi:cytochrome c